MNNNDEDNDEEEYVPPTNDIEAINIVSNVASQFHEAQRAYDRMLEMAGRVERLLLFLFPEYLRSQVRKFSSSSRYPLPILYLLFFVINIFCIWGRRYKDDTLSYSLWDSFAFVTNGCCSIALSSWLTSNKEILRQWVKDGIGKVSSAVVKSILTTMVLGLLLISISLRFCSVISSTTNCFEPSTCINEIEIWEPIVDLWTFIFLQAIFEIFM